MNLRTALRLGNAPRLALTGAGGKTTALFQLARQFAGPVLLAASTHLSVEQARQASRHWMVADAGEIHRREAELLQPGSTLITGPVGADERHYGASPEVLDALFAAAERHHLPLIIEADGSRRRPVKAPADHEPVIPAWVDVVAVVAGLSALGQPLDESWVHRPERFSALSGIDPGKLITVAGLARVLSHLQGGLKGIPSGARRIALLNQVDTPALETAAGDLARLLRGAYDAILRAGLNRESVQAVYEREAGIVLAAGQSARFGAPKVLLEWQGVPLVRRSAEVAVQAGLDPVIVVVGEHADAIRAALKGLAVHIVPNPAWAEGQSTSLRAGLSAATGAGCAVFLLADQPYLTAETLRALLSDHRGSLAPVIAPRVRGQRTNPVLFDRVTFADLGNITGDRGGRAVMEHWPVRFVDMQDEHLLVDIDTPEDYLRLLAEGPQ